MKIAPVGIAIAVGMLLDFIVGGVLVLAAVIHDHRAFVRAVILLVLALQLVGLGLWILMKSRRSTLSDDRHRRRAEHNA